VLLDRQSLQLNGLVVQHRRWLLESRETIVPLNLCLSAFNTEQINEIRLDLSARQFETLKPYWEYQGETSDEEVSPTWLHCNPEAFFIYHPPHPYTDFKRIRNCGFDTVQFSGSSQVWLNDGGHGRIKEYYFWREPGQISPVLASVSASMNVMPGLVTIPASWVKKVEDEKVLLDLNRGELARQLAWPTRLASLVERVKQEENS
jgi:hypothetical protein